MMVMNTYLLYQTVSALYRRQHFFRFKIHLYVFAKQQLMVLRLSKLYQIRVVCATPVYEFRIIIQHYNRQHIIHKHIRFFFISI